MAQYIQTVQRKKLPTKKKKKKNKPGKVIIQNGKRDNEFSKQPKAKEVHH